MRTWTKWVLLLLGLVALSASTWAQQDAKETLKERALTFWNARAAGDWATEYRFLQPGDTHGGTEQEFIEFREGPGGAFRFSSVKVGEVAVAKGLGWVKVSYDSQSVALSEVPPEHHEIWDIWEEHDGQWYPMAKEERKQVPQLPPELRPAAEETALLNRAEGFWKAREQQDTGILYGFLDPDYQKAVTREQFVQQKPKHAYLSHRIEWVEVVKNRGRVKVAYTRKPNETGTQAKVDGAEAMTTEEWYKIGGQWYRSAAGAETD